jgi:hypothetical protein
MMQRLKSRVMPIDPTIRLMECTLEVEGREGPGVEQVAPPDGK